ncbi:MAG: hypothetical protein WAV32_04860 [Halobacteriota archaeon]
MKIENMSLIMWCKSPRGRNDRKESEGIDKRKGGEKYDLRRVYGSWLLQQPLNKPMFVGITKN